MARSLIGWISAILVIVGAINWGLVGLSSFSVISYDWDLVALIFGSVSWLAAIIYVLVGLAGIYELISLFKK